MHSLREQADSQTVLPSLPIEQVHCSILQSPKMHRGSNANTCFKATKHPSSILWLQHSSLLFLLLGGCWHDSALWLSQPHLQEIRDRIIILEGKQFLVPILTQSALCFRNKSILNYNYQQDKQAPPPNHHNRSLKWSKKPKSKSFSRQIQVRMAKLSTDTNECSGLGKVSASHECKGSLNITL